MSDMNRYHSFLSDAQRYLYTEMKDFVSDHNFSEFFEAVGFVIDDYYRDIRDIVREEFKEELTLADQKVKQADEMIKKMKNVLNA